MSSIDCSYSTEISTSELSVKIRNLCKKYENGPPVINNLYMSVKKGTIYSLLGSSGCGKTSILACIVGLIPWDSGDILVFGKKPGTTGSGIPGKKLGYMPQDVALYDHLTIMENIQLYRRIYGMTRTEAKMRWELLLNLLELPMNSQLIKKLSGGEKRRASLALALIHSPKLVILDEPTVGLDPLLRKKIWNYIKENVLTQGTTFMITTHYIEEARFSHTVGFMRRGRLIAEDTPTNLLEKFQCDLLDQVVIDLCRNDESLRAKDKSDENTLKPENMRIFKTSTIICLKCFTSGSVFTEKHEELFGRFSAECGFDSNEIQNDLTTFQSDFGTQRNALWNSAEKILGLTTVILLTFLRYPSFFALLLIMPSIQGSLSLWSLGFKPVGMSVGVVNFELENWTSECSLPKHADTSCDLNALSCQYINQLQTDDIIVLINSKNEEQAIKQVHDGKTWGYIAFPSNYSQHNLDRAAAKQFATATTVNGSNIHIHLDYSDYISSFFIRKHMIHSYLRYVHKLLESCLMSGQQGELPLFYRKPVYGNNDDNYLPFVMPGILTSSLMGIMSALVALLFIADRDQGTLNRAHVAGLTTYDVVASHLLAAGVVTIGQTVVWNVVLHLIFGFESNGSLLLYLVYCVLVGLCGAGIGLLIAVFSRDAVDVLILGIFILQVCVYYGGAVYPMEFMPHFWQSVSSALPNTLPTKALRSIVIRGLNLTHPLVWPGYLMLVTWTIITVILSVIFY